MTLTLRAVSLNDHLLTQPITAHFDAEGGSVGRGDHNTLALPDPERHISRHHAEIRVSGTGYAIRNVGSSNPIIVRGQALARGESALLAHRDQVRIGGYLLEVIHEAAPDVEADTVVRGRAAVDASTPGVQRRAPHAPGSGRPSADGLTSGIGDLNAPLSRSNPFADLLGEPLPQGAVPRRGAPLQPAERGALFDALDSPRPPAAGVDEVSAAWAAPARPLAQPLLPDDFDPFAPLVPVAPAAAMASTPPRPEALGRGAFDDLIPGADSVSIDALFGLQVGVRDPLADFMAKPAAPRNGERTDAVARGPSLDPMALFDDVGLPDDPSAPPLADHVPELHAAFTPPAVAQPPTAPSPVPPAVAAAPRSTPPGAPREAWQGTPRELWDAFCEGAEVEVDPQQGINPELMRMVGSLLRASVAGTLQLMAVRASAKHELRADVTMIQARNNNPLKFAPDARAALEQVLQPPMRGFLAGPAAMTDAMHDLVGHTIGTMAGTRAALEGVLDRFTPERLEAKLTVHSVLDSLLPMNRKAKLWTLYLQHFEAIRNEAQDDFHSLFGRAFLAAYEQQLERLQRDEPRKN
jgi:FHA domain-containing protein